MAKVDKKIQKKKFSKIVVDRDACISAATCIVVSPDAFELDAEGIALVKGGVLKVDENQLLIAAQSCPTQAILLFDSDGNQVFP